MLSHSLYNVFRKTEWAHILLTQGFAQHSSWNVHQLSTALDLSLLYGKRQICKKISISSSFTDNSRMSHWAYGNQRQHLAWWKPQSRSEPAKQHKICCYNYNCKGHHSWQCAKLWNIARNVHMMTSEIRVIPVAYLQAPWTPGLLNVGRNGCGSKPCTRNDLIRWVQ